MEPGRGALTFTVGRPHCLRLRTWTSGSRKRVKTTMDETEDFSPSPTCRICDDPSIPGSWVCARCRRLLDRMDTRPGSVPDKAARRKALRAQRRGDAFVCAYTGIELTEANGDTRFATWEHRQPGDESSVVLVADLVNRMKGDMSESEFSAMVRALADLFQGKAFDESAFPIRQRRV
jgi:hypothetical protein